MNAMAELRIRYASSLKFVINVAKHFFGNFFRLREEVKMGHDETDVVDSADVV